MPHPYNSLFLNFSTFDGVNPCPEMAGAVNLAKKEEEIGKS